MRATVAYSSEDPSHPVAHLIDGQVGRGATRWASRRANATEQIVLVFDHPRISRLSYEVEESAHERTQEIRLEVSTDLGRTYRQVLAQDYTFSPQGATFQHEDLRLGGFIAAFGASQFDDARWGCRTRPTCRVGLGGVGRR
jgi:F5/8 type C domain